MSRRRFRVATPADFRFRTTLYSHGWVQLRPFRHDAELTRLERTHRLADGAVVHLTVTAGDDEVLEVAVDGADLTATRQRELAAAVGRVVHLDLDLAPFYERLRGEERYAWVERAGAGRLLRCPTVWEDLAKTLLTTNTTWGGTRKMVERLTALGEPHGDGEHHAFPEPERIAALAADELDAHLRAGYRSPYLHALAADIAAGDLDVESWADPELGSRELYERVTALQGFGPYAAGNVLKLLGHYDELALDSSARAMFARQFRDGEKAADEEIEAHYAPYGQWRGLVLWMDMIREWFHEDLDTDPGEV